MSLLTLLPNLVNILDKFIPDKDLRAKLELEIVKGLQNIDMAQIEVNKEEAKHKSLFVSGWRPGVVEWHFATMQSVFPFYRRSVRLLVYQLSSLASI
jgi:hypothetical protein